MKIPFLLLACSTAFAADASLQIKLDQVGYLPDAPKIAVVAAEKPAAEFLVRRTAGDAVVLRGKLTAARPDADSGDAVQLADFSPLADSGRYYLEVPGVGRSWNFAIGADVYQRAYYLAMRSFYGQRCGTAVDLGPEFPGYRHDACHLEGAWHASSGKSGPRVSHGGWHDAGDYGRYIVNSGITTGTLLWTWEMFGARVNRVSLNIPESGNGTPDILSEIKWNLDWMLSMQDDDGGVWPKQTSEHFCGFVMPDKDSLVSYVIGTGREPYKTSCATADFATVMAIAARAFRPFDRAYAGRCLTAARKAWTWVAQHPDVTFLKNPPGIGTGLYGDTSCADERLWAAAELSRTTGDTLYEDYFQAHYTAYHIAATRPQWWSKVGNLALWTYALGGGKNSAAVAAIRRESLAAADSMVERTAANGYRNSLAGKDYEWGSNGNVANYALQLLVANSFHPDPRYRNAALDNLHYLLGRNTFSLSFVTRVGENPFRHPHNRLGAGSGLPEPWPGLLSGGPNPDREDPTARNLPAGLPPAKLYVDDTASYSTNEIAINWNAALVFLLAATLPAQ
ncbi:MAG: glycoside hydrolase family 9 protein [Bryobacteraceae bacterium]